MNEKYRKIVKKYNTDYVKNRRRQMGNMLSECLDHTIEAFKGYNGHVFLPEMIFDLRISKMTIWWVTPTVSRGGCIKSTNSNFTIVEIPQLSGIKFDTDKRVSIIDTNKLIECERSVSLDDGELYLYAYIEMASHLLNFIILPSKGGGDTYPPTRFTMKNLNLPSVGGAYGPYPAVEAFFYNERSAIRYKLWLEQAVIENPRWFSYEGGCLRYSPDFFTYHRNKNASTMVQTS
ncbi:MAG: hypothetical protein WC284_16170 [Candidimonas sp.]